MSVTSALIVSYVWPPTGGVGAQRVLKLAKYLPQHGVIPAILTVDNPSVPLVDRSLMRQVPSGIEVLRARTFEPGYKTKRTFWEQAGIPHASAGWKSILKRRSAEAARQLLIPDPQLLWQPHVQRVLLRRLRSRHDDVVLITAPPFSSFLSAPLVRRLSSAKLVLDYRDEWRTLRTQYEMLPRWSESLINRLERRLLRSAHAVTVATEAFREQLLSRFPLLDPARVVTINNGFDRDDCPSDLLDSTRPSGDRFVITYAGTVFKQTSPQGLLGALRLLREREPVLSRLLTVRFFGRIVDTELAAFAGTEELGVERRGFVPHNEVIRSLAASHLTLCLLDSMPGAERIYPAKAFELMMIGRPCLTLAPEGALAELVRRHRVGPVLPPRNQEAIADFLAGALRDWMAGRFPHRADAVDIAQFDRSRTAERFADLFREIRRP